LVGLFIIILSYLSRLSVASNHTSITFEAENLNLNCGYADRDVHSFR